MIELPLQYAELTLLFQSLSLKLFALEALEFLRLICELFEDVIFVLLEAEESPLILLQHPSVVVNLTFEDLIGIFCLDGGIEGCLIEHALI